MSVLGYQFKEFLFSIPSLLRLKILSASIERDDGFFPLVLTVMNSTMHSLENLPLFLG